MSGYYYFHPVNISVKGGLSMTNGNCLMVTRLDDSSYQITDSKLGDASPIWKLNSRQFHRLGRHLNGTLDWAVRRLEFNLGDGLTYTQTPLPERMNDHPGGSLFECALSGFDPMRFTFDELIAFDWGYYQGQFPVGDAVRELVFTV